MVDYVAATTSANSNCWGGGRKAKELGEKLANELYVES